MKPCLSVLGGSTPFTAVLIDELVARADEVGPHDLVLHGRDSANLELLRRFATGRLAPHGWSVRSDQNIERALEGADTVLHQIRYGDLELRRQAEDLCRRFGVVADETLGAAALVVGLATRGPLDEVCAKLRRCCPDAFVLNLTNPLSITTAWMHAHGVDVVGLCELPSETARMVANRAKVEPADLEWSYTGLNHRGFVYNLQSSGEEVLPRLLSALGEDDLNGVDARDIRDLEAVPLKYFRTITDPQPPTDSRAKQLVRLRADALKELEQDCVHTPASLSERMTDWYRCAVVPLLVAREGGGNITTTLNLHDGELVRERRVSVSQSSIEVLPEPAPPAAVVDWVDRFEAHERSCLAALDVPNVMTLSATLAQDLVTPPAKSETLARAILEKMNEPQRSGTCMSPS